MTTATRPGVGTRLLDAVLAEVAAGAAERDRTSDGAFPARAVAALQDAGALAATVPGPDALDLAAEHALVRAVARADAGVARILDGHLNAVERLVVHAEPALRDAELAAVAAGGLQAGVWGADPVPGEGDPAALRDGPDGPVLRGVKTFCSGAGGLDRALVLVTQDAGAPLAAWVDLSGPGSHAVDRTWFGGGGMRASASHRVVFDDAPVLAVLGAPGALTEQPWFARDAVRTAATWVGAAEAAAQDALGHLAARPSCGELEALAAGRIAGALADLDLWLRAAPDALAGPDPQRFSVLARDAIARGAALILDEAARACGSRPFAAGGPLDRARRDLGVFLLQHRLDPAVARVGRAEVEGRR